MKGNCEKVIDGVLVRNAGGDMPDEEIMEYISRGRKMHGCIKALTVKAVGDDVDLQYYTASVQFDRIRRITGYLVGTLDRFNNGKRAEERDRVKHDL